MASEEIREEVTPEEAAATEPAAAEEPSEKPSAGKGGTPWGRLFLVGLLAALLGVLVTANWHDVQVQMITDVISLKAGVVILASAVLGFVLGVVFIWSALERRG
jgi:uncharacterized integral membrane protein